MAIQAFHYSAAQFTRFSMAFIGTGDGKSAWGKGLYFADSREIAERYRRRRAGFLYEVEIQHDPEAFLVWDRPLREQSEIVRDGVFPSLKFKRADWLDMCGCNVAYMIRRHVNRNEREILAPRGIAGIRYKAIMSMGDQSPRNYVLYSDQNIAIRQVEPLLPESEETDVRS